MWLVQVTQAAFMSKAGVELNSLLISSLVPKPLNQTGFLLICYELLAFKLMSLNSAGAYS